MFILDIMFKFEYIYIVMVMFCFFNRVVVKGFILSLVKWIFVMLGIYYVSYVIGLGVWIISFIDIRWMKCLFMMYYV